MRLRARDHILSAVSEAKIHRAFRQGQRPHRITRGGVEVHVFWPTRPAEFAGEDGEGTIQGDRTAARMLQPIPIRPPPDRARDLAVGIREKCIVVAQHKKPGGVGHRIDLLLHAIQPELLRADPPSIRPVVDELEALAGFVAIAEMHGSV
jgi:hypothetical protein